MTLSPWIYHELAMTSLVRICKPSRTIQLLENALVHKAFSEYNDINIEHNISDYLDKMITLKSEELELWDRCYAILTHRLDGESVLNITGYEKIHSLDVLYNLPVLSKIK